MAVARVVAVLAAAGQQVVIQEVEVREAAAPVVVVQGVG
jgi:hypothetical protein